MPIKVLVLSPYNRTYSKKLAEYHMFLGLKQKGVDLTVVTEINTYFAQKFIENNIRVLDFYPKSKYDRKAIRLIRKELIEGNYDLIHLIKNRDITIGLKAAKGLAVKKIAYMGSTSVHWHDPLAYFSYLSPGIDAIICVSEYIKTHVQKQLFFNKSKAISILKGYETSWFKDVNIDEKLELNEEKKPIVICCVANNRKVKGINYLLKATYHLNTDANIKLLIIGEKTKDKKLLRLASKSPLKDKIELMGYKENTINYIKQSDLYIQTSVSEGLGRAILEAMSLGVPPIMTNAGGCTELIEHQKSGLIVKNKSPKAIAEAIEYLCEHKEERLKMGKEAKKKIDEEMNIRYTIKKTFELYQHLTEKK